MRFPGLYGNDALKRRLTAAGPNFSHFYILEGPRGSGKKTLAAILASAMECTSVEDVPCGVCSACRKVLRSEHPDVITVDSDTATVPIRLIREMQADAYIKPNEGRKKIYLLPRAQDMQPPAQNALLKLLEEPPEYCVFLLLTDSLEKLLETVRSRAVSLTLSPLTNAQLRTALREREPEASQEDLDRAIEKCDGYLGPALDLLHKPESQQDRQADAIAAAFATGDELELLNALLPLEKMKRQELIDLLTALYHTFTKALEPQDNSRRKTKLSSCTGPQLYQAVTALSHAISLLQANGSAGHAVGSLLAQMQQSS